MVIQGCDVAEHPRWQPSAITYYIYLTWRISGGGQSGFVLFYFPIQVRFK